MFLKYISLVFVVISLPLVISHSSPLPTVDYEITRNGTEFSCKPTNVSVTLGNDIRVNIHLSGELTEVFCITTDQSEILNQKVFPEKRKRVFSAEIKNATKDINGTVNCQITMKYGQSKQQVSVTCSTLINVVPKPEENSALNIDKTTLYYIGGGVAGFIILLIIIIQAIYLKRYKNMIRKKPGVADLKPNTSNVHEGRYSTMPTDKKFSLKNNRESQIYHSLESIDTTVSRSPIMRRPPMPLPDDEHIYDDGETLTRMFAPQPPAINTLPKPYPNKSTAKVPVTATKPKVTAKPQPKLHVPEDYDYPDTQVLIQTCSTRHPPKKNSLPLPEKPEKTQVKSPLSGTSKIPGKPPGLGNVPIVNELENHFKKMKKNESAAPPPKTVKPSVTAGFRPGFQPAGFQPAGSQTPRPHAQRFQPPESQPHGFKKNQPIHDRGPQFTPGPRDFRPQVFNPPIPPLSATPRSPLPTVQKPLPLAPGVQSPPLHLRPMRNIQPYEEETYSEVAENSDEDEWTYEPLKEYNLYNV